MIKTKNTGALALASALLTATITHADLDFGDITFWVGSGANQAALVIDWNDDVNPDTYVWGYRWDGVATGKQVLDAVIATDFRLSGEQTDHGWGWTLDGLGFDLNGDGDTSDPGDHFQDNSTPNSWWSYWVAPASPYSGGSWGFADFGFDSQEVDSGDWNGWSWNPDWNVASTSPDGGDPITATAVPEPSILALLVAGVGAVLLRRRVIHFSRS